MFLHVLKLMQMLLLLLLRFHLLKDVQINTFIIKQLVNVYYVH